MAYAREIQRPCGYNNCPKTATYEVLDAFNSSYGTFCKAHAEALVRKLKTEGR